MKSIENEALKNNMVANALIGQAIIDEGFIGAGGVIEISYTSEANAKWLWKIGNAYNLVHPIKEKKCKTHKKWLVKFKPEIRNVLKELGDFPDERQQKMINHLLNRNPAGGKQMYERGESKEMIIEMLKKSPLTIRELSYGTNLSASTVKTHIFDLQKNGVVVLSGLNKESKYKNQRTAKIWKV